MDVRQRRSLATPHLDATPGPSVRREKAGGGVSGGGGGGGGGGELPSYEPPSFPLNVTAQRGLASLVRRHNTTKLEMTIKSVQEELSSAATDLHDKLREKKESTQKRRERQDEGKLDDEEGVQKMEQDYETAREKAEDMTKRMEEQLRKLVDATHRVAHMKQAVAAAEDDVRIHANTQASTQDGRTQQTRISTANERGERSEEDELPDFTPTDPGGRTQPEMETAPKEVFKKHLEASKIRYQSYSLRHRYAEDENYATFKRAVHDARYPDDQVPMPPPEDWFDEGRIPAPGASNRGNANDDHSDDDIAIERTVLSTKCALTLQEFRDPLSSKKCRHNFEKDAILEMLKGVRQIQCPASGCAVILTRGDLHIDKVTVRKIKRIQEAKLLQEENEDESGSEAPDGTQRNRSHIIDDDDEDRMNFGDIEMEEESSTAPKTDLPTSGVSRGPRSAQIIDLGEGGGEEHEAMDN